jgi:DNA-3-methyladenine glycosylase I
MTTTLDDGIARCPWGVSDPLYIAYHDEEWGVPVRDDRALFEMLMLEGFQAGLSWITVLKRRESFARAFEGWDPEKIARYGPNETARLMADPGIIRNRLKVEGAVRNARAYLAIQEREGSFSDYLWQFTGGDTLRKPPPASLAEIPVTTAESDAMSKALKREGFTFVGSTICYALMQSVGMVNDHVAGCFRAASS